MPRQHPLVVPVPIGTPQCCLWMAVKDTLSLPPSAKRSSPEQLHADGLTMGKLQTFSHWSAEVAAATALPLGRALGEPTALCSQYG